MTSLQWHLINQILDQSPITKKEADKIYYTAKQRKKHATNIEWRNYYKSQSQSLNFMHKIWIIEITNEKPLTVKLGGSIHVEFQITKGYVTGYVYSYPGIISIAPRFTLSGTPKNHERNSYDCKNFIWSSDLVDFALFLWEGYIRYLVQSNS